MKGMRMESPWRTVQVFISSQAAGIFEVEVDSETKNTRCTCPVWRKTSDCKHTNYVKQKMKFSNGHYSINIPIDVPENLAVEANHDAETFREFVLKYAKIEVL